MKQLSAYYIDIVQKVGRGVLPQSKSVEEVFFYPYLHQKRGFKGTRQIQQTFEKVLF